MRKLGIHCVLFEVSILIGVRNLILYILLKRERCKASFMGALGFCDCREI